MSICESKLNFEKIKVILKKKYNINCIKINKIINSSANIFVIFSDDNQKYVLKEFQDNFDSSKIEREILVINYLRKNNIPTPVFLKTIDEKYFFSNENNFLYLQRYIDGKTQEFYSSSQYQQAEMAIYYSKILKLLNASDIKFPNYDYKDFDNIKIEKKIYKFESLINKTNNELVIEILSKKIEMLNNIVNDDFWEIKNMTRVKTHGDYNVSQIIYDSNDKIKGILDFASAKEHLVSWELFRSYLYMDPMYNRGYFNFDGLINYLKIFNLSNLLNIYDLKNMFFVYFMHVLNSSFGLEQYILNGDKNYLKIGCNLFYQCMFLNNNMNKLESRILLKKGEIIK